MCVIVIVGLPLVSCSLGDLGAGSNEAPTDASVSDEQACLGLWGSVERSAKREWDGLQEATRGYALKTWPKMEDGDLKDVYRDMSLAADVEEWATHMATIATICDWDGGPNQGLE